MASKAFSFTKLVLLFISRLLLKYYRNPKILQRNFSNSQFRLEKHFSIAQKKVLSNNTVIFNVEGALLKSSSVFSYFMLVAFEAGSLLRVLFLFLLYPLICVVNEEASLKIMAMVCFFGIKKERFRVGSGVLPKFFLEGVGLEGFEVMKRGGRSVGVSDLPQVMVECFLKDYLEIDVVLGRDLKVKGGYFVGLMEDRKNIDDHLSEIFEDEKECCDLIGISSSNKLIDCHCCSSLCKEIYLVNEGEKRNWHSLPKERDSKPLIFHDGRLALRPTPLAITATFIWLPFGSALAIIRAIIAFSLPFDLAIPILALTGMQLKLTKPKRSKSHNNTKGHLYVCNHRTLLDPVFVSFCLKKPLTAVTYIVSRISELISPIRTVRLRRDRDQDGEMMEKMLSKGDLVVCPKGTTCREPYLLRFSPLFTELSDEIVPVGVDTDVSMFYGTTAGGLKCFDPFFFLLNPSPCYHVLFLDSIRGAMPASSCTGDAKSKFDVHGK
ncbi:hypothetical protein LguiB_001447 [Lonicera macranthoides]